MPGRTDDAARSRASDFDLDERRTPQRCHGRKSSSRLGLWLFGVYLLLYTGFVWLSAFNPQVMSRTPLFGVNVSGLKIGMTGYAMQWSAGTLWSGGAYGPEGSVLTSVAMLALAGYLWRAPIAKQKAPLLDAPPEV